jgi:hypothetical protein
MILLKSRIAEEEADCTTGDPGSPLPSGLPGESPLLRTPGVFSYFF